MNLRAASSDASGGFGSRPRLAIAMWDFSWLTRRTGAEAEYAHWEQVLDELATRGYDCVRIDAFPHLVADQAGGDHATVLPERYAPGWGNTAPVRVEPRAALVEFIKAARDRDIRVGLSTWLTPDARQRRLAIRTPADLVGVWGATLDLLDAKGLIERVVWVDLCNEFPFGGWGGGWYPDVFDARAPANSLQTVRPYLRSWGPRTRDALGSFMTDAIAELRTRRPEPAYTFSWTSIRSGALREIDTPEFDLAEVHVWLSDTPGFGLPTGATLATAGVPGALAMLGRVGPWLWRRDRRRWREALSTSMDVWADWARNRDLALFTTEAWAVTVYGDLFADRRGGEWDWVKELCRDGVELAVEKGWTGICTSNFCQPHFAGMWADVGWHRELTGMIRGS